MKTSLRILYLEDNENDALLVQSALDQEGFDCRINRVETRDDFAAALVRGTYDIIFSDFTLPSYDGESALKLVTEKGIDTPFIYVSGTIGEGPAIDSLLHGATDYVLKGTLSRLVPSVRRALRESEEHAKRIKIQQSLIHSEERFRILFEDAPDAYFLTDVKGTFVDGNKAAENLSGYNKGEFVGKNFLSLHLLSNSDLERAATILAKSAKGQLVGTEEYTLERKNGEFVCVEIRNMPVTIKDEKLLLGIARDITDRKRAEDALEKSERTFHELFDEAPIGYHECDNQGRIVRVNRTELDMLGYGKEEMLGRPVWEFIVEDETSRKAIVAKLEGSMLSDQPYERTFRRRDGATLDVLLRDRLLQNEGGKVVGIRSALQDVSELKKAEEVERLHTTALESTANGVVITGVKGDIVWVNKAFAGMTGYTELEVLGKNLRIVKSGHQPESFYKALWETIAEGNVWHGELVNKKKDGSLYTEEMTITPLKNTKGVITNFIAVKQDISERKHAESERRLLAQTVASARDCITITDLKDRLIFVNESFQNTYGYTIEELFGKDISILRPPGTPAAIGDQILHDTLGGGWHGEILNRRKDGSDFPAELWTSIVRDDAGAAVAMVGVARNITDRIEAEEHLKKSEEQFRLIAENVADMIAVLDLDGRRIYNSPSYRSILGDPKSLAGTDGFQEIHPDDVARVKQVFQETVRTGVGQQMEYRFLRNDGSERTIDSKGSVIRDREGEISQVVVVSRDVTEEKKLAAQFLRAQRMESIGTLAGGIAHDLNNILAPILMAIEILKRKVSDQSGLTMLNTLETSAKRGADIVRQVLAFGRGVKGERILVQLKHIIDEVIKIAAETFPKSIDSRTNIPRDLWTVLADPTQMHQVLLNMLVNARDAMPKGGSLTISAENITLDENYSRMHLEAKPGPYVSIVITDTGTGIPADIREKIFEPFFTTKDIGKGTGLGLSTALAIVKSHGGFINLESEMGKGTTFRIYFPATGSTSGVPAASQEADLPMGNGELILIIDDEAAVREITKETLQAHGYDTITASDGAEGVAVFAENKKKIKAVITDIMMPVMDGIAVIHAMKRIRPDVKIISASGLTSEGQGSTQSDTNVKAFLAKPYTAEKLLKVLAEVLE
jgi:PAS domain S-box-containing protein